MAKRHKDANAIWNGGACNPRGVARALVSAIDEACDEKNGHAGAKDAGVQMILDHLCFLCGMPQPSMALSDASWWEAIEKEVEESK